MFMIMLPGLCLKPLKLKYMKLQSDLLYMDVKLDMWP
jgi:hypothetical protein